MSTDQIEVDDNASSSVVHANNEGDVFPGNRNNNNMDMDTNSMIDPQPFAHAFGMPPPHLSGLWATTPMLGANQVVMETHMGMGHPVVYPTVPSRDMSGGAIIAPHPTHLIQQNMMPLVLPNSNPVDPLENILGVFPCAKLKGLPKSVTIDDILVFFSGLVLIDIVIPRNVELSIDERSIEANESFVLFANPMDFQMGLQRDHQLMGYQHVEVSQGKRHEYYVAIAVGLKPKQVETERIQAEGDGALGSVGRGSIQQQQQIGKYMRGNNHSRPGTSGGGIQHGDHTGYLRMRGLPFSASQKDVLKFFFNYKIVEESIVFTFKSDGRATGEAYLKFCSPDEARKAMSLNRKSIGLRYIELFIATADEHTKSVTRFKARKENSKE